MPRALSLSRADSKVIWLDITEPSRISSAVRSDTSVTSWPCRTSPSASAVPAGPAPTTAIRRVVDAADMAPASHRAGERRPPSRELAPQRGAYLGPHVRQRVDHRGVIRAGELAVV